MVRVVITFKVIKSYAKWLCINRFNLAGRILLPWNVFPSEGELVQWWHQLVHLINYLTSTGKQRKF